jgi:hypothetical protein
VKFFNQTGTRLPLCEQIENLKRYPVLMLINDSRLFALNFKSDMPMVRQDNNRHDENYFYEVVAGAMASQFDVNFYPTVGKKLHQLLPKKDKLTQDDIKRSIGLLFRDMETKRHGSEQIKALQTRLVDLQTKYVAT